MGCVLVVEDDVDIREATTELLSSAGFEVLEAANGKHALDVLRTQERAPCLVLLDLMMPVMSGREFLEALRDDDAHATVPIVVVSAFGAQQPVPRANRVLVKPMKSEVLLDVVREFCHEG